MPSQDNYFKVLVDQTGGKKKYTYELSGSDIPDMLAKGISSIGSLNEPIMQRIGCDMHDFAINIVQAANSKDRTSLEYCCKNYAQLLADRLHQKHVFQVEFNIDEDNKNILRAVDTNSDKYKGAIYGGLYVLQNARERYKELYPNGQTTDNSQVQDANANANNTQNTNTPNTQNANNNTNTQNGSNVSNLPNAPTGGVNQPNTTSCQTTNNTQQSTPPIPGQDQLDNISVVGALLDDLKAGLRKSTAKKMQEQQTSQHALKDVQDSNQFQYEINKKQREGILALISLLSDANNIFLDNKGEFARSVKKSLDLMNQGNAELETIANKNGEFQDSIDTSYVIYESFIEKLENAVKSLSRCNHNFKNINGKIIAAGMLAKSLAIMRTYNTEKLLEAKDNQFLSSIKIEPQLNYTYGNTFMSVSHNIQSFLKDFNNEITCDNLAIFLSTHCIADLSDSLRAIIAAVSDSISQNVTLTYYASNNPYYYQVGKAKSLQQILNQYTSDCSEKKDFLPIIEIGKSKYIGYNAPYSIPKYVDKIDATTSEGNTLEYISTVIDQKIQSLNESKLMPFGKEFLFTSNILDSFVQPFPTNYSVDESGNRMNSNVDKYLTVRDSDFKKHVLEIQKKLDVMLSEYAATKEVLEKFKKGCDGLGDVTLTEYDSGGVPQNSSKSVKELASQQLTQIEKMLEIRKDMYLKNANLAVMRLFHKGKIEAIKKTLEKGNIALNNITKVIRSISHLIPTEEEKIFEETIEHIGKRTEEISENITKNFLKILANCISVLGIPIKSLESVIETISSSVKFESFRDKQINFINNFTEKLMNLVAETVEFCTGLLDMYDKFVFKVEEKMPNFKLFIKTFILVFVVAFLTQNNPELLKEIIRIIKSLIPDTQTTANVVSPF